MNVNVQIIVTKDIENNITIIKMINTQTLDSRQKILSSDYSFKDFSCAITQLTQEMQKNIKC